MKNRLVLLGFWTSSVLFLVLTACQSGWTVTPNPSPPSSDIRIGEPIRVSQTSYVFEPHIAIALNNPSSLAAVVVTQLDFDCDVGPRCSPQLVLYTSDDGGETWAGISPFEGALGSIDGTVAFGPDGTLFVVGIVNTVQGSRVAINSIDAGSQLHPNNWRIVSRQVADKPWITIHPETGIIYIAYSFFTQDRMGISLAQSNDGGKSFLPPVVVYPGIDLSRYTMGLGVGNAHTLTGSNDQLAVIWQTPQDTVDWPSALWIAQSSDGGKTFSVPAQIGTVWGIFSATSDDKAYYIVARGGTEQQQELNLMISTDQGHTWRSTSITGALPLYFDWDKAPGVAVDANGTIDIVFYAHGDTAPACVVGWAERSPAVRRELGWVDPCTYDVLYTFSKGPSGSFIAPIKLNEQPIPGERFTRVQGYSKPGEYMGMESTNEYAYPIWIDTKGDEGTEAVTLQIER